MEKGRNNKGIEKVMRERERERAIDVKREDSRVCLSLESKGHSFVIRGGEKMRRIDFK